MTWVVLLLTGAYAVVAGIALIVLFSTRIPLLVRGLTTLAVAVLIFATYWGIGEIRGLPSDAQPPELFKMHWARVVEPDKLNDENGYIFLWLEALDEDNYPSGLPRAYQLPYSRELAEAVETALRSIQNGDEVAGQISDDAAEIETGDRLATEIGEQGQGAEPNVGERFLQFDFGDVRFGLMPAPVTPDKPEG